MSKITNSRAVGIAVDVAYAKTIKAHEDAISLGGTPYFSTENFCKTAGAFLGEIEPFVESPNVTGVTASVALIAARAEQELKDDCSVEKLKELRPVLTKIENDEVEAIYKKAIASLGSKAESVTDHETTKEASTLDHIPEIKINGELEAAINTLIDRATGGKIVSLSNHVLEHRNLQAEVVDLKSKLSAAVSAAAMATAMTVAPVTSPGSGEIPAGKVSMKKCYEVFGVKTGEARKILDFDIPVFEWSGPNSFVPEVDETYKWKPLQLLQFAKAMLRDQVIYLNGLPGTGKTSAAEQFAARTGWMFQRFNGDADITRAEFVGGIQIKADGGGTTSYYKEGILIQAMQQPVIFCLDEIDYMRPENLYALQPVLEPSRTIRILEDGGRLVKANKMFRIVMTGNTKGQGDELGLFPGAKVLSNATLDRVTKWMTFDYLSPAIEEKIITDRVPHGNKDLAKKVVSFGREIREAFKKGEIFISASPRTLVSMFSNMSDYSTLSDAEAVKLAVNETLMDKATGADFSKIREIQGRVFA